MRADRPVASALRRRRRNRQRRRSAVTASHRRRASRRCAREGVAGTVKDKTADMKDSSRSARWKPAKVGETAAHVKEQATHVKEQVETGRAPEGAGGGEHRAGRESAGHLREQAAQVPVYARQQWHDAQLGFWQTMDQKPFAIGMAALAAGVAAGLTVPSSRKEKELMGETRDRLLDQAQGPRARSRRQGQAGRARRRRTS